MTCSVTRHDLRFPSGDSDCAAWLYLPDTPRPPVVVLGHGLGATREMRLNAFAERFAAAGIAALAFTYRHFGDSGGQPRQLLSISRQLADWDAAITHVQAHPDLDGQRVAVWGTSFGGGHAITVAARHPELRAAVAQCPFTDGVAAARALGPAGALRLLPAVTRDLLAGALGREPVRLALTGPPGTAALMTAPDAAPGYRALVPPDMDFVDEVAARVVPTITAYRPGRHAREVIAPILFCVCDTDSVAPARPTLAHARTAPRAEIRTYPAGHFDIYLGNPFDAVVADQTEFLTRHLAVPDPRRGETGVPS